MFGASGNDGLQMSIFQNFEFYVLLTPFLVEFQKFRGIQHFDTEFWCWQFFVSHLFFKNGQNFRFPRWLLESWNLKCNNNFLLHSICCCSQFKDWNILCILGMRYAIKFSHVRSRICKCFQLLSFIAHVHIFVRFQISSIFHGIWIITQQYR